MLLCSLKTSTTTTNPLPKPRQATLEVITLSLSLRALLRSASIKQWYLSVARPVWFAHSTTGHHAKY